MKRTKKLLPTNPLVTAATVAEGPKVAAVEEEGAYTELNYIIENLVINVHAEGTVINIKQSGKAGGGGGTPN